MELLVKGAAEIGINLTQEQVERFDLYFQELMEWNGRMNLTAIVDPKEAQLKHFLDSLTTSLILSDEIKTCGRIADVGSGGGFPGIPLKLAFPGMHLVLVESVAKKTRFLEHVVRALELGDVDVRTGRAEDLGHDPELRESFDVAVSRGVAPMRILMELTLPYCRIGGVVVTMKKGEFSPEIAASLHAMGVLGGSIREMRGVDIDGLKDGRALVVVEKVSPTPSKFPRRPGLPKKHPL